MDLSGYKDIAEYFLQAADSSESEADTGVVVAAAASLKKYEKNKKSQEEGDERKKIRLVELGPRLDLELFKITEGLNGGQVLFHHNS